MKAFSGHELDSGQKTIALCFCGVTQEGKMHNKMMGI